MRKDRETGEIVHSANDLAKAVRLVQQFGRGKTPDIRQLEQLKEDIEALGGYENIAALARFGNAKSSDLDRLSRLYQRLNEQQEKMNEFLKWNASQE